MKTPILDSRNSGRHRPIWPLFAASVALMALDFWFICDLGATWPEILIISALGGLSGSLGVVAITGEPV